MAKSFFDQDDPESGGDPMDEERRVCERRFQEAFEGMAQQRTQWRDAEKTYWNEDTFPARFSNITQVKIGTPLSIIEGEMSLFADFLPTFDYMPVNQAHLEVVDGLQKRKEQLERSGFFRVRALDAIRDAQIYGIGLVCIKEELDGSKLLKKIDFEVVDPFTFFPATDAVSLDLDKTSYISFATPMEINRIKRTFEFEGQIKGETDLDQYRAFANMGAAQRSLFGSKRKSGTSAQSQHALVKECYWKDAEGTLRHHTWVGEHTLDSGATKDRPSLNYFQVTNYKTAHTLMGMSEARMLTPLYRAVNRVFSQISNAIQKYGSPRLKVLSDWFHSRWNKLTHTPGEQLVVERMADVEWEDPPTIPSQTFQFLQWAKSYQEDVTGYFEAAAGRLPGSDASGRAVALLQEASQGKMRLKNSTWHTDFMIRVGQYIFWLLKTYDRQQVDIRIEGEKGGFEFVQHNGEAVGDLDVEVEVAVVGGTRLPAGRVAAEVRAQELFEKGIYGIEDTLEAMDEPDRALRIQRYYERQGVQAMVQRQEELQDASGEAGKLIDAIIEDPEKLTPENVETDRDIDHLIELLAKYPELLQSPDFNDLPEEVQMRLAAQSVIERGE